MDLRQYSLARCRETREVQIVLQLSTHGFSSPSSCSLLSCRAVLSFRPLGTLISGVPSSTSRSLHMAFRKYISMTKQHSLQQHCKQLAKSYSFCAVLFQLEVQPMCNAKSSICNDSPRQEIIARNRESKHSMQFSFIEELCYIIIMVDILSGSNKLLDTMILIIITIMVLTETPGCPSSPGSPRSPLSPGSPGEPD